MCLIRNHSCTDTWPWDTAEQLETALATMPAPESWAAASLTGGAAAAGCERPWVPTGRQDRFDTAKGPEGGPG